MEVINTTDEFQSRLSYTAQSSQLDRLISDRLIGDFERKCEDFFQTYKRSLIRQFSAFIQQAIRHAMQQCEEVKDEQIGTVELPDHEMIRKGRHDSQMERLDMSSAAEEITAHSKEADVYPDNDGNAVSHEISEVWNEPILELEDIKSSEFDKSSGCPHNVSYDIECKGEPDDTYPQNHSYDGIHSGASTSSEWMDQASIPFTRERPHTCPFCCKSFTTVAILKAHLRIHTGERPYICSICGMSFTQCSNLKSHKRVHTRERPYPCSICGKAFAKAWNLKVHIRLHQRREELT